MPAFVTAVSLAVTKVVAGELATLVSLTRTLADRQLADDWGSAILEPGPALRSVPTEPLVGGRSTHALGFSGLGRRPPAELDPAHQELPAKDVETRRTMGHESFLRA
jgi:hypothetical protein